jgi:hypothetical protein
MAPQANLHVISPLSALFSILQLHVWLESILSDTLGEFTHNNFLIFLGNAAREFN